jgi:hypothetical protein
MKKQKLYRYIGRNGEITSPIFLEDAKHIPLMELRPEAGYVLTNGNVTREYFVVVHIDEVNEWTEVKADTVE